MFDNNYKKIPPWPTNIGTVIVPYHIRAYHGITDNSESDGRRAHIATSPVIYYNRVIYKFSYCLLKDQFWYIFIKL